MSNAKQSLKKKIAGSLIMTIIILSLIFVLGITNVFAQETPAQPVANAEAVAKSDVMKFGLIAAALAFGFGAVAAGIAVGNVGAAAMGAIGEKPEIAGQAIIFVALAEGLAVFGLIIAILILGRI